MLICLCSLFSLIGFAMSERAFAAGAEEVLVSETVQELPDGSSIVITVKEQPISTYAASYMKAGTKTYSMKNSEDEVLWEFVLHGTFLVRAGVSATCSSASTSYNIYHPDWYYVNSSSYYSGNKAYGNATFEHTFIVTIETRECSVTLACDANGNLS